MSALLWFFGGVTLGLLVLAVHGAIQRLMQPFNVAVMAVSAIHHQRQMERAYRLQQEVNAAVEFNQRAVARLIEKVEE